MLLVFTFIIKSFSPTVDVSIGDYKQTPIIDNSEEIKKKVDGRLAIIQEEDQGKNFSDLMKKASTENNNNTEFKTNLDSSDDVVAYMNDDAKTSEEENTQLDPVYKVFIGTYTSAEQAKVARDIIIESGSNYNPIIKCIGLNNYTLQVGLFKNRNSAETLLYTIQQNHLPGRIVQEY
jgi:cell division protein FtsN